MQKPMLTFPLRPLERPTNMLNDDLLSGLTWGDLERAYGEIACPAKQPYVAETLTALWNHSQFWSESLVLSQVLVAAAWLIHPEFVPGPQAEPLSPS